MDKIIADNKARMQKAIQTLRDELAKTRTGRASLGVLDGIKVDYYGVLTPLNQVAALGTPDARTISIQPWEATMIPEIEKAVLKSGIGLNPVSDGKLIRLPIPALTEERRREIVKGLKKHGEDCKVAIRNIRRDANEALKGAHLTEDALKKAQNDVQKLTDEFSKQADDAVAHKEKEIMTV
jgi:ribosome recycling factor